GWRRPAPAPPPARPAWPDRPNFDGAVFAERDLLGPLDGFVLRVAPNHLEPTEELLRLCEGPVVTNRRPALSLTWLASPSQRRRSVWIIFKQLAARPRSARGREGSPPSRPSGEVRSCRC